MRSSGNVTVEEATEVIVRKRSCNVVARVNWKFEVEERESACSFEAADGHCRSGEHNIAAGCCVTSVVASARVEGFRVGE
jgi:hypothetical protein